MLKASVNRSLCLMMRALLITTSLAAVVTPPAKAALGEQSVSVANDRVRMKATAVSTTTGRYSVHELRTPYDTLIREYVSDAGVVFAVTWQGPFQPDLQQLLGSYFDKYRNASRRVASNRNQATVESEGLIVHAGGHARAFMGRAYVLQLLPAGVSVDEIQ
jgi:Protein of unknown function (DUF2844)